MGDNVKIITIGKSQYESYNGNWTNSNDVPVVLDASPYEIWNNWNAGQRDLFFLDSNGNYATNFNISSWNYDNIYDTILTLLPEDSTCDEIEEAYESIHNNTEYTSCNYDNDCEAIWGDCSIGLGGCHYTVNDNYPEDEVASLASQWLDEDCMEWVCDCMDLPYAQCVNGTCTPSYCNGDNPAGCFETGCDEGYECVIGDECIPSSCFCDGIDGSEWSCTEDCGGGVCQPMQLSGDLNNDGLVNVIDVVTLVNIILTNEGDSQYSDINNDGLTNVIDVVLLVSIILD